jgi:excisionase family DNA binding protein
MAQIINLPQLLTEREAASRLGISAATLARLRRARRISHRKIGSQIRYTYEDIAEHLNNGRIPCRVENLEQAKSPTTGSASAKIPVTGAAPGSIQRLDKHVALASALKTLSRPS